MDNTTAKNILINALNLLGEASFNAQGKEVPTINRLFDEVSDLINGLHNGRYVISEASQGAVEGDSELDELEEISDEK